MWLNFEVREFLGLHGIRCYRCQSSRQRSLARAGRADQQDDPVQRNDVRRNLRSECKIQEGLAAKPFFQRCRHRNGVPKVEILVAFEHLDCVNALRLARFLHYGLQSNELPASNQFQGRSQNSTVVYCMSSKIFNNKHIFCLTSKAMKGILVSVV